MLTPAGVVALKLLRALRVSTVAEARPILAQWAARPRLAPGDIRDVLAELGQADGDDRGTEHFDPSELPPRGTVGDNLDGGQP